MDAGLAPMAARSRRTVKFRVSAPMESCLPARTTTGEGAPLMDHDAHRPGTVPGCESCRDAAYEPGWYATLLVVDVETGATALRIPEDAASLTTSSDGVAGSATDGS